MSKRWDNEFVIEHSQRLLESFAHWTSRSLMPSSSSSSAREQAQQLYNAPFVVVSHGTEDDPIFNYGNAQALALWSLDWDAFTSMASRQPTKGEEQPERAEMLAVAKANGYFEGYVGDRSTGNGRRFRMEDGLIWTVLDEAGNYCGQAATFSQYHFLT